MGYERVNISAMRWRVFVSVFTVAFLICFVLQAYLAKQAGHLGSLLDGNFGPQKIPDGPFSRIMFFEDAHNLFNYALLVPLYFVAGTGYMISLFSLTERMAPVSGGYGFELDQSVKPMLSGMVAVAVFVFLLVTLQAGYAVDVQTKSLHLFWFHGTNKCTPMTFNGYAYLVINTLLAGFVIFIALLHLELFRWSKILSLSIREYEPGKGGNENVFANDGNRLKELFAPFTETAIWSKSFAMLLAFNIYTWKESGVSGGPGGEKLGVCDVLTAELAKSVEEDLGETSWFFRFVFVLFVVIALWIVSLPRYRIQYELFKLRRKEGVHEYFDIRMPWTIGWSVFIDLLLFTFFATAIFGSSDIFNLMASLFPS